MKDFKKYIIWFIIWLLWVWTMTYAAWNGTIGDLFTISWGHWVLIWDNIKDNTIDSSEIENGTIETDDIGNNVITEEKLFTTLKNKIAANTAKVVFSWNYNDLINKPSIPIDTKLTEAEVDTYVSNNWFIKSTLNWTFNVKQICDENWENCVDVSSWLWWWAATTPITCTSYAKSIHNSYFRATDHNCSPWALVRVWLYSPTSCWSTSCINLPSNATDMYLGPFIDAARKVCHYKICN
jgi:hypothetical protein